MPAPLQGVHRCCGFRAYSIGDTDDTAHRLFDCQDHQGRLPQFADTLCLLDERRQDWDVVRLEQPLPTDADPNAINAGVNPQPRMAVKFAERRF